VLKKTALVVGCLAVFAASAHAQSAASYVRELRQRVAAAACKPGVYLDPLRWISKYAASLSFVSAFLRTREIRLCTVLVDAITLGRSTDDI
jgi:hypothetical protein